nr:methylmalonyl Co-A mutase-associated GTPase MeaB [Anaerolineae bacterium]
MTLVKELLSGSKRALARVISQVENDAPAAHEALAALFPHTGHAHLVGVTGAPGTGKSTLVNCLTMAFRERGDSVGIVAIDPTSPYSGGAILGDRIRMRDLSGDSGVFIRSMASRGSLGGIARKTADVVKVMDAAGFDIVVIETVGAGQSEIEIARLAQTVLVVEAPGLGDDIQAFKAGILEIADILVVNKADDPRAGNTERALKGMLELADGRHVEQMIWHHGMLIAAAMPAGSSTDESWQVPIHLTNAISGDGVTALVNEIYNHRAYLNESGELSRRTYARVAAELDLQLREHLMRRLLKGVDIERLQSLIVEVASRRTAPHQAVETLLDHCE